MVEIQHYKTCSALYYRHMGHEMLQRGSLEHVSLLGSYKARLPVMQSEKGLRLQSLLLHGLSEADRGLQVVLISESEGSPVNGHRLLGLKVLVNPNSLFWIDMLPLHHIPGQVSADGDRREVKWSEAPADLVEASAVARIASEKEPMIRT